MARPDEGTSEAWKVSRYAMARAGSACSVLNGSVCVTFRGVFPDPELLESARTRLTKLRRIADCWIEVLVSTTHETEDVAVRLCLHTPFGLLRAFERESDALASLHRGYDCLELELQRKSQEADSGADCAE